MIYDILLLEFSFPFVRLSPFLTCITHACIIDTCFIRIGTLHPTPKIQLSVIDTYIMDTCIMDTCIMDTCIMHTSAWVTRPERPKGAKDEVKEAPRATD